MTNNSQIEKRAMTPDHVREVIESTIHKVAIDFEVGPLQLRDDTILLECGLDSMAFATVVVILEEEFGEDPFLASDSAFYPTTLLEFSEFYINYFAGTQ